MKLHKLYHSFIIGLFCSTTLASCELKELIESNPTEETRTTTTPKADSNFVEPIAETTTNEGEITAPRPKLKLDWKVTSIRDGDTFIVRSKNGTEKRIRMYGIDSPELAQDFGREAKVFSEELCLNQWVAIEDHGTDKYNRWLAKIILADGTNLNYKLVEEGFAWKYHYSKDPELARLELKAKENQKGLWSQSAPEDPYQYRKENKR